MSSSASVYVGPYAVWAGEGGLPRGGGEILMFDELGGYFGEDVTAEVEYGRGDVEAVIYVPVEPRPRPGRPRPKPRPGAPERAVRYDYPPGGCAASDLRGIDREAELEAFRKAYAAELAELTAAAGREPVYGWGLVYCYS